MTIGRRIERTMQITRLLQATLVKRVSEQDQVILSDSLLTIVDSLMTYRRRYRYSNKIPELLELVVCDENNPRSLAYQLTQLEEHAADCHSTINQAAVRRLNAWHLKRLPW